MLNALAFKEVFHNDHRVVSQKGSSKGRFTFTAADSGEHKICVTPSSGSSGGWLTGGSGLGGIKLTLDMAIGETSAIESTDKGKILDIVDRVKDLNSRLTDVRREQIFQRVCSPRISLILLSAGKPSAHSGAPQEGSRHLGPSEPVPKSIKTVTGPLKSLALTDEISFERLRNERPSSATNPNRPTLVSFAGR